MTEFIAMIYEWFNYSTGLGDHLRGLDVTCSDFIGTDLYMQVFFIMLATNVFLFILMYLVIDKLTSSFSSKMSWWITAVLGALVSFGIAYSLPSTIQACEQLGFNAGDLMLYGFANAIWSIVTFALLTSFPFPRNLSTNCRLTTFWKP